MLDPTNLAGHNPHLRHIRLAYSLEDRFIEVVMGRLSLVFLWILGVFSLTHEMRACDLNPFQLKVQLKGATARGAKDDEALHFAAKVVSDKSTVYVQSDAPFIKYKNQAWFLDKGDTQLSQQNTMLEFYGYFKDGLDMKKLPSDFLTQTTREKFEGISVGALLVYPSGRYSKQVQNTVTAVFGNDAGKVLADMKERNGNSAKYGMRHFSRPSYLSSKEIQKKYGDATVLTCMALAYGMDLYTNPKLTAEEKETSNGFAMSAIRTSLLDRMAAEAIRVGNTKGDVGKVSVKLAKGGLECKLSENTKYELKMMGPVARCGVIQPDPVVRQGPDLSKDERFIQVGHKLYTTVCTTKDKKQIDLSDFGQARDTKVGDLLKGLREGLGTSKLGKDLRTNLDLIQNPSEKAKAVVQSASAQCDRIIADGKDAMGKVEANEPIWHNRPDLAREPTETSPLKGAEPHL